MNRSLSSVGGRVVRDVGESAACLWRGHAVRQTGERRHVHGGGQIILALAIHRSRKSRLDGECSSYRTSTESSRAHLSPSIPITKSGEAAERDAIAGWRNTLRTVVKVGAMAGGSSRSRDASCAWQAEI